MRGMAPDAHSLGVGGEEEEQHRHLMGSRPRILVLTLSFGSGHFRAAHAIAQELRRYSPTADVRVADALEQCFWLFRAGYVWPYWLMVRYWPSLWGHYFASRVGRKSQATAPEWAFLLGCSRTFKTIAEFEPDTIVAAEVAACEIAVLAKRREMTKARIIGVITDYTAEPVWVMAEVDTFTVPDEGVRGQLVSWGAPAEKVVVCGIPTDPTFAVRHDAERMRLRFGLRNDNIPLVLLMGGGMGPTRMDLVAEKLCASRTPMGIVAITGNDIRVRRRLNRVLAAAPVSMHVLGWTEEVAALMQAASLLVTKPGGLTTAEAALCALPLVAFDAIPGPEQHNAARLVKGGGAVVAGTADEAADEALGLLGDADRRQGMSRAIQEMAYPDAAGKIASLTLNLEIQPREAALGTTV
jgi:processive 1,2-diacylglycerol beta-glucosyltransferase